MEYLTIILFLLNLLCAIVNAVGRKTINKVLACSSFYVTGLLFDDVVRIVSILSSK